MDGLQTKKLERKPKKKAFLKQKVIIGLAWGLVNGLPAEIHARVKNARHIDRLADDAIDHHMLFDNKGLVVLGEVGPGVAETGVFCDRLESLIQSRSVFLLLSSPVLSIYLMCNS